MSEEIKGCYFASGVFKIDYKAAGFKDLQELAKKWSSQDENFRYLEIRKVSHTNWGIQFIYYNPHHMSDSDSGPIANIYRNEIRSLYGDGMYAQDYMESNYLDKDRIIVYKTLE